MKKQPSKTGATQAPKTSLALQTVPSNALQTGQSAFEAWLQAVPPLQGEEGEHGVEISIPIIITLPVGMWLDTAHVAAVHGHSLEDAINLIVEGACLEDNFMNQPRSYRGEDREVEDAAINERLAKREGGAR